MRFKTHEAAEVGWISTADIFILASCFFLSATAITSRKLQLSELTVQDLRDRPKLERQVESELEMKIGSLQADSEMQLAKLKEMESRVGERDKTIDVLKASEARLKTQVTNSRSTVLHAQEELKVISGERDELLKAQAALEADNKLLLGLLDKASDVPADQKRLNNELLGLGGQLREVVILIDISQSMRGAESANNAGGYWGQTLRIIKRWITNLDVGAVSIITFGDVAEIAVEMDELDQDHRQRIVSTLDRLEPTATSTDFLSAFRKAYALPGIDTIIVFSDGLPTVDVDGRKIVAPRGKRASESRSEYVARRDATQKDNIARALAVHAAILRLAEDHPFVAVNAIGLGDKVYTPQTGNLLNDLTLKNGGVFIALPAKSW